MARSARRSIRPERTASLNWQSVMFSPTFIGEQPEPLAVLGHQRHAGGQGLGRMAERDRLPVEQDRSLGLGAAGAEQAFEQFRAARPPSGRRCRAPRRRGRSDSRRGAGTAGMAGPGERQAAHFEPRGSRRARLELARFSISRPTIRCVTSRGVVSAGSTVVTSRPSRSTVIRSASRNTSSILCEM